VTGGYEVSFQTCFALRARTSTCAARPLEVRRHEASEAGARGPDRVRGDHRARHPHRDGGALPGEPHQGDRRTGELVFRSGSGSGGAARRAGRDARTNGWATHRLELQPATGAFRWTDAVARTLKSAGDPSGTGLLQIEKSSEGTLSGTIGSGVWAAKFKVKVGKLPISDDPNTRSIDESSRYYRIEVVGLKPERGKVRERATRIDVIVEKMNFTEYVLYDGEDVVIGMGSGNDRDNVNLISEGWVFGRNFVHLGNIIPNGTRLQFVNMGKILSDGRCAAGIPTTSCSRIRRGCARS